MFKKQIGIKGIEMISKVMELILISHILSLNSHYIIQCSCISKAFMYTMCYVHFLELVKQFENKNFLGLSKYANYPSTLNCMKFKFTFCFTKEPYKFWVLNKAAQY